MANFATCINGHNYNPAANDKCPHCPTPNKSAGNANKTQILEADTTVPGDQRTVLMDGDSTFPGSARKGAGSATMIFQPGEQNKERKLVGFLVTYRGFPQGKFFPLYEGKNLIGSHPSSDVAVTGDSGISVKHLTILFRAGIFRFKDEFSTNGTFINGEMQEEGTLEDKTIITLGSTAFCFLAIPEAFKKD